MLQMQVLQAGSCNALYANGICNETQQHAQDTATSLEQMLLHVSGQQINVRLVYNPTFKTGNELWIYFVAGLR